MEEECEESKGMTKRKGRRAGSHYATYKDNLKKESRNTNDNVVGIEVLTKHQHFVFFFKPISS